MSKNVQNGLAMPKAISSYIKMFNPDHQDIDIDRLVPLPESSIIHGAFDFNTVEHERMTNSMLMLGQYRYITVSPGEGDKFWIIDGVRNVNAAKDAGYVHISCIIINVNKEEAFEIMQVLNSGHRKLTYAMKAKKLDLIEKHAKQYLKDNNTDGNEESNLTVRQYMATILGMSETYVSDLKAVSMHPERDVLLDQIDCKRISLKKAAAIARNKSIKIPELKKVIVQGIKQELACVDCPRRRQFMEEVDNHDGRDNRESASTNKEREDRHA